MLRFAAMVKHIATPRRRLLVALIAALAASGCGVKGPLVPAPKPAAETPPTTTPQTASPATDTAPVERKP
jgi:predicted small lipoprotein YifL